MMPEPVRVHLHAALLAAPDDDLVDPRGGQRSPVARPEPQLRPVGLVMPRPGPQVAVEVAGSLVTDPDGPILAPYLGS